MDAKRAGSLVIAPAHRYARTFLCGTIATKWQGQFEPFAGERGQVLRQLGSGCERIGASSTKTDDLRTTDDFLRLGCRRGFWCGYGDRRGSWRCSRHRGSAQQKPTASHKDQCDEAAGDRKTAGAGARLTHSGTLATSARSSIALWHGKAGESVSIDQI